MPAVGRPWPSDDDDDDDNVTLHSRCRRIVMRRRRGRGEKRSQPEFGNFDDYCMFHKPFGLNCQTDNSTNRNKEIQQI